MRQLLVLGVLVITLGCNPEHKENDMSDHGHHGHQHGGHAHRHGPLTGAELVVATDPADPVAGRPVTLRLMIHAADGAMVKDFEVVHEEKVHLVIVRDGLDHFAHIHPAVDPKGNLTVTHTFPAGAIPAVRRPCAGGRGARHGHGDT
jgi:hypothetical protein